MIYLAPTDQELTWQQIEPQFQEIPDAALKIWRDAKIMMPDDADQELMFTEIESFFTATAAAVGLPAAEIYPARNRLRWYHDTETPNLHGTVYASLDGGTPARIQ